MSRFHNDGPVCYGCASMIGKAHPKLKEFAVLLRKAHPDVHFSWVWRGPQDQEAVYKSGASNCRFGESQHNKMDSKGNPCSRAFDVFIIDADGVGRWPPKRLAMLHEWKQKYAPNMRSDIIKFKNREGVLVTDYPHFEVAESVPQP